MSYSSSRPKWWQVYLTLPLLVVLFMVDSRLKISSRGHQAVQIGIVLLVYGLIHLWIKANAKALRQMDESQYQRTITVIEIPPIQLSDADKHPLFQFPNSEIKGLLSDATEMNFMDTAFAGVDEVSQPVDKE